MREFGRSGLRRMGGTIWAEPLRQLQGEQGRAAYSEMSQNDATVGRVLYAIEQVILSGAWHVEPGEGPDGEVAAEFIEQCMGDMSHTWEDFLTDALTMLPYGWAYFEKVLKYRRGPTSKSTTTSLYDDGKVGWRKFAFRAQDTLDEWLFDEAGGIQGMKQRDPETGGTVEIPIGKSLLFRTKPAGGNPEGASILRRAYRSWYMKKRIENIEAIGIERDLAGLPVVQPPEGVNLWDATDPVMAAQLARVEQLLTSVRIDDQAGVALPHGWEFRLERGGGAKSIDTNAVVARLDWNIAASVLAQFLELGKGQAGSYALSLTHKDLFAQSVRAIVEQRIAATVNRFAVGPLLRINGFRLDKDPEVVPADVASPALDDLAGPISELLKSGGLTADDELEAHLRDIGGLPAAPQRAEGPEEGPPTPEIEPDEQAEETSKGVNDVLRGGLDEGYKGGKYAGTA